MSVDLDILEMELIREYHSHHIKYNYSQPNCPLCESFEFLYRPILSKTEPNNQQPKRLEKRIVA